MNQDTDIATALALCEHLPISATQIVRLILELVEESGGQKIKNPKRMMAHCRQIIRLGLATQKRQEQTVPFLYAYEETLKSKAHQSPLTLRDIRYYLKRLMKKTPKLENRPIRNITTEECATMLASSFSTPTQRKKARAILSGLFTIARKRGWCSENPVSAVDIPHIKEREIRPLSLSECKRLLTTANLPQHRSCAPALGLMLWAGVRPHEVKRLTWNDIDTDEKEIIIPPRHSKTGGGRHIPLCNPLLKLLLRHEHRKECPICPPNWTKAWSKLRKDAGFYHWIPDVLRHTFASFHAKMHHNLSELSLYMGHSNNNLLRERYVNMRGISKKDAIIFWLPT